MPDVSVEISRLAPWPGRGQAVLDVYATLEDFCGTATVQTMKALLYGEELKSTPLLVLQRGTTPTPVAWSVVPGPFLVRHDVVRAMESARLTGWTRLELPVVDECGAPVEDYLPVGITGRCESLRMASTAEDFLGEKGVACIGVAGWDGSDLCVPRDSRSFPLLSPSAVDVLAPFGAEGGIRVSRVVDLLFGVQESSPAGERSWNELREESMGDDVRSLGEVIEHAYLAEYGRSPDQRISNYTMFSSFLRELLWDLVRHPKYDRTIRTILELCDRMIDSVDRDIVEVVDDLAELLATDRDFEPIRAEVQDLATRARAKFRGLPIPDGRPGMPLPKPHDVRSLIDPAPYQPWRPRIWSKQLTMARIKGRAIRSAEPAQVEAVHWRTVTIHRLGRLVWPIWVGRHASPLMHVSLVESMRQHNFGGWDVIPAVVEFSDGVLDSDWFWIVPSTSVLDEGQVPGFVISGHFFDEVLVSTELALFLLDEGVWDEQRLLKRW